MPFSSEDGHFYSQRYRSILHGNVNIVFLLLFQTREHRLSDKNITSENMVTGGAHEYVSDVYR